jgi:adenylate kinase
MLKAEGKSLDKVLDFEISDEVLVERCAGRLIHKASGRSYHTKFNPPKVAGKDDITGDPLIQRDDDKADTVRARLGTFHAQTAPVRAFYGTRGSMATLKADAPIDAVWKQIETALGER